MMIDRDDDDDVPDDLQSCQEEVVPDVYPKYVYQYSKSLLYKRCTYHHAIRLCIDRETNATVDRIA